jgi:hypothetical protein
MADEEAQVKVVIEGEDRSAPEAEKVKKTQDDLVAHALESNQKLARSAEETAQRTTQATEQSAQRQKQATEEAAGALGTFKERLSAIAAERERALAGMGDQMAGLQKQFVSAQAGGDVAGATQAKDQIIAIQREIVQAERDALIEVSKQRDVTDEQYVQVKQAQYRSEQELRNLDLQSFKAAEEEKRAASKQTAQQEVEAEKQAAQQVEERLTVIADRRTIAFAGIGDQLASLQKDMAGAQVGGNVEAASQNKQQIIAIQREIVQAQRDALAEMAKDQTLTEEQFKQVKQAQFKTEQELRNLDVQSFKAAEEEKQAVAKQTAQAEADAAKQAANAQKQAAQEAADAAKKTADAQKQALQEQKQALQDFQSSMMRIGVAAGVVSAAILSESKQSVEAYAQLQQAVTSTNATEQAYLGTQGEALAIAQRLSADGIIPLNATLTATRRLMESGLGADQAEKLLIRFKDAAANGRKEGQDMATALDNAARSFQSGEREMARNAGLMVDFTAATKAGAQALGIQTDQMTMAQRAQAWYNGVMEQTTGVVGAAARMQQNLTGEMEMAKTATTELSQTLGGALAPLYEQLLRGQTGMTKGLTEWVSSHQDGVRSFVAIAGGATTAAAAVAGLSVAFIALISAVNPVAGVISIIAGVTGALVGAKLAADANAEAFASQTAEATTLQDRYNYLQGVLESTTATVDDKKKAEEQLVGVMAEIGKIMPDVVTQWDREGNAISISNTQLSENIRLNRELLQLKAERDLPDKEKALREAQSSLATEEQTLAAYRNGGGSSFTSRMTGQTYHVAADEEAIRDQAKKVRDATTTLGIAEKEYQIALNNAQPMFGPPVPLPVAKKPDLGNGTGGNPKMSDELQSAMQDIQDIKSSGAVDKLEQEKAKVSQILTQFGAELEKFPREQRALLRRLNEEIPREINSRDFQGALSDLLNTSQMEDWSKTAPTKMQEGLRAIKAQFASFLADPANKALAQGLELKIKQSGEAIDAEGDRRIKKAYQDALDAAKQAGKENGPGAEADGLRKALTIAFGLPPDEMLKAVRDLTGQISDLQAKAANESLQTSLQGIQSTYEKALVGLAPQLHDLDRQMVDAATSGDSMASNKLQQKMLELVRPALEVKVKALQELLDSLRGTDEETAKERVTVEKQLNSATSDLYKADLDAYRLSQEEKVAIAKQATEDIKAVETDLMTTLRQAQKDDLDALRASQAEAEKALDGKIKKLERQKEALKAVYDWQKRLQEEADVGNEIASVKRLGGFEKYDATLGRMVETYDETKVKELQDKLAGMQADDAEKRREEALDAQIRGYQDQLTALKESHQDELREREKFWADIIAGADQAGKDIETDHGKHLQEILKDLKLKIPEMTALWDGYAASVQAALDAAAKAQTTPPPPPGGSSSAGSGSSAGAGSSTGSGGGTSSGGGGGSGGGAGSGATMMSVAPGAPAAASAPAAAYAPSAASAGSSVSFVVQGLSLALPGVTDAAGFAQALPGALASAASGGFDLSSVVLTGRQQVRGGIRAR